MSDLEINQNPRVIDDIYFHEDKCLNRKKYFIGSEKRNICLKVNEPTFEFLKLVVSYIEEKVSLEIIEENFDTKYREKVEAAIKYLNKMGLMEDSEVNLKEKVEIEMSGKVIKRLVLDEFQKNHGKGLRHIYRAWMFLMVISLIFGVVLFVVNKDILYEFFIEGMRVGCSQFTIYDIVFLFLTMTVATLLHEIGHILAANYFGYGVNSFTILLKFGIMPIFYIRYKNFHKSLSNHKLIVLISGVAANFTLAILSWIGLYYTLDYRFIVVFMVNLGMIISCLSPVNTSDGYYLFAILFNIEQCRWKMLTNVSLLLNKKIKFKEAIKNKGNLVLFIYFIVSYSLTFISIYFFVKGAVDMLGLESKYLFIICLIFVALIVTEFVKKFIGSVKNISVRV